jgi:hypothetical protein
MFALLPSQVLGFDLLLILCFVVVAPLFRGPLAITPADRDPILALQILERVLGVHRIHRVQVCRRIPVKGL